LTAGAFDLPIPDFTEAGLLPAGVHDCTMQEAEQFLCSNEHRQEIWNGLQAFLEWIDPLPAPAAILIDGSYVTDKALPSDVDVVVDITGCSIEDFRRWAIAHGTAHAIVKEQFRVDFYPYAIGVGNDFSTYFQYVRIDDALRRGIEPETRKGILKVLQ
jgi:hypothetical protein